jgi:hypothetical protein
MKNILIIIQLLFATQHIYSQDPCYGNDPNGSCCNGIINTDVPFKVNTERPSLINNWNWTTPSFTNSMTSSLFTTATIANPYYETNGINWQTIVGKFFPISSYSSLNTDSFPLLDPKKGWQVLAYNFGKDYLGNPYTTTNDLKDPHYVLYNKYTGQMRVLFTIENNSGYQTRTNVILGFPQTGTAIPPGSIIPSGNILGSGLFAMYNDPKQTLDEISAPTVIAPSPSVGGSQWSVADYTLQYDPCVCNRNSQIQVRFKNFVSQNINLSGRGVGVSYPFNSTGTPPGFGPEFMMQVAEGFNGDGTYMYNQRDDLSKAFYVPPMSFVDQLIKKGMNTAFNAGISAGTGGLVSLLSSAMAGEITPFMNQSIRSNKDFTWALHAAGINGDTTGGIFHYDTKEVAGALAGLMGASTKGFSMQLYKTDDPTSPNFFWNEFEIKMVGTSTGDFKANRNDIILSNPGSLLSKTITPIKHYPLYNEPLGLFAMLRKPKIKRRENTYKNETAKNQIDPIGYIPIIGPIFADNTYVKYNGNYNKLEYEIGSSIDFVLNPSAEIDYEKTQISAAWKIPIIYKKACGGDCNSYVVKDADKIILSVNGKQFCQFLPDSFFNLTRSNTFIKISKDTFNDDTTYYSTPYIPIEHFKNMRFSYDLEQRACTEFKDMPEGIRLSMMVHYVYKPNAYGEVNEHFQTLDYGVEVETTTNFTKPKYILPTGGIVTIGNTVFTKDTIIYADSIVLNGTITTINGAKVTIISTKPLLQVGGSVDPTISYYQGSLYPASKIIPLDETLVKSFCASSSYKASSYPYSNKFVTENGNKKESLISKILIYPNPTTANTTLELSNYEKSSVQIRVYDMIGREVWSRLEKDITLPSHKVEVESSRFETGMYIINIDNGVEKKSLKLEVRK